MDSASQGEGLPLVAPTAEGAPSVPAMGEKEGHGTTPACSTRAAMKKVCLLCQIVCTFDLWLNCVCTFDLWSICKVWITDRRKFGSLIQESLDH